MGFPPMEYKEAAPIVFFNGCALEFLQATYRDPTQSLHTRMRAAIAALPFESPKLQATAIIGMGLDFSIRLERAVKRSDSVRLLPRQLEPITAQPEPFRRRF
jgi:hypothetical protein